MTMRRLGDIVLSLVLLALCLPVLVVAAFAVWLDQSGSPLLRQERLTRDGRKVSVFRLRTTLATVFGPRPTPLGKFLRRWNVHEIPQLLNVLNGELSLIGGAAVDGPVLKKVFALRDP